MTTLFDEAYKNQKDAMRALSLGEQAFCAHTKFGNWRNAQQVANKMYKTTQDARHAYWAAMSAVLQVRGAHRRDTFSPLLVYGSRNAFRHATRAPQTRTQDHRFVHSNSPQRF